MLVGRSKNRGKILALSGVRCGVSDGFDLAQVDCNPRVSSVCNVLFGQLLALQDGSAVGCMTKESLINPLMPELNPSMQCCLTRFFTGNFAS
jgi:hypothetical protein